MSWDQVPKLFCKETFFFSERDEVESELLGFCHCWVASDEEWRRVRGKVKWSSDQEGYGSLPRAFWSLLLTYLRQNVMVVLRPLMPLVWESHLCRVHQKRGSCKGGSNKMKRWWRRKMSADTMVAIVTGI